MSRIIKSIVYKQSRKVSNLFIRAYSAKTDIPQFETLAVSEPKKHVFHVELNRPDKLNSFSVSMWKDLKLCFSSLHDNTECRVIVLSGRGKHFTAGIDLNSLISLSAKLNEVDDVARKARLMYRVVRDYQDGISALEKCVKPVLNVIHHACVGAGVNLITAADVRYCTQDAWFQVKEVQIGLAADVGVLQRLPKVIGSASVARDICFTARKVDAEEALRIGLVSKVFPDKDTAIKEVLEVAEGIAKMSPVAVQATKQNMVYSQDRTIEEGLEHIALLNAVNNQGEDMVKAAMAQATKGETPEYDNL